MAINLERPVKLTFARCPVREGLRVVATFLVVCIPVMSSAQPAQGPSVPVTVTHAARQDVPVWLRGLGTVQANYAVQLRPRVDGTLTQVPVKEGQDVKQGDLLAVIDPRPYQAILDAAVAKKQQDQAQLSNAQADLARYASLVRQDFASRQQLDTQAAMVKQFSAAIVGDDAQIEAAQLNLSFCYITSPFAGRIGLRNVDPGNIVHSAEATPIISVTQIQPISVTFTLPQDNLPAIMKAMETHPLDVVIYASDNTTELDRGVLLTPDNTIDITTGTIKLKATFSNTHRTLWPGQFVNAGLLLGTQANVVTVSATSVQHGPDGLYVYQVGQNETVSVQPITVARQEGDVYVVSSGLTEGATVVATGQSRLQAGARVTVREAQATPPAVTKSGS
jgi:membrane fusion protein, multidrug efflux system